MQSSTDCLACVICLFGRVLNSSSKGTYLSPPSPSFRSPPPPRPLLSTSVVAQNRKFFSHFIQKNNESLVSENGDIHAEERGRSRFIVNDQFYSHHESYSSREDDVKTSRHYYLGGNPVATREKLAAIPRETLDRMERKNVSWSWQSMLNIGNDYRLSPIIEVGILILIFDAKISEISQLVTFNSRLTFIKFTVDGNRG